MASLIRGVLRGRITASITGGSRHRFLYNISNKAALKDDIDMERMSRDCRLTLVKAVAAEAERMIAAHDSKITRNHRRSGIGSKTCKAAQ